MNVKTICDNTRTYGDVSDNTYDNRFSYTLLLVEKIYVRHVRCDDDYCRYNVGLGHKHSM